MLDKSYIISQLLGIPGFILFLCFRGLCQAWTSRKLGDPTAYLQGYMTMNPTKHINLIGLLFLLIFGFGFSNPVPVNTRNFKNIKRDNAFQILSSPVSGILLMFISALAFYVMWFVGYKLDLIHLTTGLLFDTETCTMVNVIGRFRYYILNVYNNPYSILSRCAVYGTGAVMYNAILCILARTVTISVFLSVFFMLPLPGFDGYKLIANFLPYKAYSTLYKIEKYSMFIFIGFIVVLELFPIVYSVVEIPANVLINLANTICTNALKIFI